MLGIPHLFQSLKGISGYYNKASVISNSSKTVSFNPWKGLVVIITLSIGVVSVALSCFNPWKGLVVIITGSSQQICFKISSFNPWKGLVVIITINSICKVTGETQLFQSLKGISGYYNHWNCLKSLELMICRFQSLKGISGYYNIRVSTLESGGKKFQSLKGISGYYNRVEGRIKRSQRCVSIPERD